jgi:hypothetical protein
MTQLKKKTAQNHANVRKHCLFRSNEISLINEAMAKAKVSFSHFVRRSAIRSAAPATPGTEDSVLCISVCISGLCGIRP